MKKLLSGSIRQLANAYRKKEVSPVEIVSFLLEEIEKQDLELNAFITVLKEEALTAAKEAEEKFLNGETVHLLCGIPYSLKDLFYTKDIKTTCGSVILKDFIPEYSATVYEKLSAVGAILIGKTNMLEFAYGIVHPQYGQTNNPWDTGKTAGGSSGGSAAAVAANLGFFSIGSDTGGSIRIPASYCGVAGLKPTYGSVSLHGVFPLSWSLDHPGPIARTVEDIAIVFHTIAGFDARDSNSSSLAQYESMNIWNDNGKVIGTLPQAYLTKVQPDVMKVYLETLNIFKEMGWDLKEIEIKDWNISEEIIMKILLPEAAHIHQPWMSRKEDYAPLTLQQIEAGLEQKATDYLEGLKKQMSFRESVNDAFKEVDVLVMPAVCFPSPAEDPVIGDEDMNEMIFTGPFNLSGHPAITVNLGFSQEGLPIGIQFVGKPFGEEELLSTAYKVEQIASFGKSKMMKK